MNILLFVSMMGWLGLNEDPKPKCEENIDPDCFCIQIYDPVCGCNKVTYGNACMAYCSGITDYTPGECKKKPKNQE